MVIHSAVRCAYLSIILGTVAVVLSISATTSCKFFSVVNRKMTLSFGIWGKYNGEGHMMKCASYDTNQEIDATHSAAKAMTIASPILGCLGMGLLFLSEIKSRQNRVEGTLAIATLILIAATLCQFFTLMILNSALCTKNVEFSTILAKDCFRDFGATMSIVSCSFFGAAYVCALLTMKFDAATESVQEPHERDGLMEVGFHSSKQEEIELHSNRTPESEESISEEIFMERHKSGRFNSLGQIE